MNIESVKKVEGGYKVNDQFFIPDDSDKDIEKQDCYYKQIVEWISAGGIVEEEYSESEILEAAQNRKVSELFAKVSEKIYSKYSMQKQSNIGLRLNGYVDKDFEEMKAFINPILAIKNDLRSKICACESVEELDEICFGGLE